MPWLLTYSLFLAVFCFSSVINTYDLRNTANYKQSCFISLAFSIGVLILAILSLCCCAILQKHGGIFNYSQMIGIAYLLYTGVSIMTQEKVQRKPINDNRQSKNVYKIVIETICDVKIAMVIISIMTQFYKNISHWYILLLSLFITLAIGFLMHFTAILMAKYLQKYEKNINFIYKLLGFVIIILSVSNIKNTIS